MNSSRYIISRLLLSFGLHRKNKRLQEAAEEAHLLRQAEEILGEDTWEQVEDIESISVEYWTLRKLRMEVSSYKGEMSEAGDLLTSSHEERNEILNQTNKDCQALDEKRVQYKLDARELIGQRDRMISGAKLIRRKYEASRTKIEVIGIEGGREEIIEGEKRKMVSYKQELQSLKKERDAVGVKIQALDNKILQIEEMLGNDRKRLRDEASSAYQSIGQANKDISKLGAEVAMIESEMKSHYSEIGHYVSLHVGIDPACTQLGKKYSSLIAQMQSLRSSIALNHKLAGMAGG